MISNDIKFAMLLDDIEFVQNINKGVIKNEKGYVVHFIITDYPRTIRL